MKGWLKLQRQFVGWQWFKDGPTLQVFLYLLCNANHKPGYNLHGVVLQPGQLITGRKVMATACGLSEQQIRTIIKRLKTTNELTTVSTNQFTVVTLTNWAKYQSKGNKPTNKTTNQHPNEQPTSNHIQELKEYKEVKEGPTPEILNPTNTTLPAWHQWLLEAQKFQELALMSVRHISPLTFTDLHNYINQFATKQVASGKKYANTNEARAHFVAWLETELRKYPVAVEVNARPSTKRL